MHPLKSTHAIMAKINPVQIHTPHATEIFAKASEILNTPGGLVVFPTETVYGLGASALSDESVRAIYAAKGRPSDNPLIVHVSSREMLYDLLPGGQSQVPALYEPLIARLMPGPLTLIFSTAGPGAPRRKVSPLALAGHPSVAVRMPASPVARQLIAAADLPLAAPSANLSSKPSPTTAAHAFEDLGRDRGVGMVIDGGRCDVGVESTVVDWVAPPAGSDAPGAVRILRAGGVSAQELESVLAQAGFPARVQVYGKDFASKTLEQKPTTPGMKYKHYAPATTEVYLVRCSGYGGEGEGDSFLQTVDRVMRLSSEASKNKETSKNGEERELHSETSSTPHITHLGNKIGLMLTDETLDQLNLIGPQFIEYPLGSIHNPTEAAQRLFAGLRHFDALPEPVAAVLVESVPESGVGAAFMERARKSAGGKPELVFRI